MLAVDWSRNASRLFDAVRRRPLRERRSMDLSAPETSSRLQEARPRSSLSSPSLCESRSPRTGDASRELPPRPSSQRPLECHALFAGSSAQGQESLYRTEGGWLAPAALLAVSVSAPTWARRLLHRESPSAHLFTLKPSGRFADTRARVAITTNCASQSKVEGYGKHVGHSYVGRIGPYGVNCWDALRASVAVAAETVQRIGQSAGTADTDVRRPSTTKSPTGDVGASAPKRTASADADEEIVSSVLKDTAAQHYWAGVALRSTLKLSNKGDGPVLRQRFDVLGERQSDVNILRPNGVNSGEPYGRRRLWQSRTQR